MTFRICEKRQSVLDEKGHCLVLGGPGSGKTTLALLKAVRRVGDGLAPGQGILFLSFSRNAVARIADAAKEEVPRAERGALSIQTFHSFCWEVLRTHGHLLGAPKQLSIVLAHDEKAMRDGIERGDDGWSAWEHARAQLFRERGRVCFDLFAPLTAELFRRAHRIRDRTAKRYPLVIVDEAQDTAADQWAFVSALADRAQVMCLADLDQLIFDYLPGVGPERVTEIRAALRPLVVDLEAENNRSPGTEIMAFGRDVLAGRVRDGAYTGVSRMRFQAKAAARDKAIRQSVGYARKLIQESAGRPAESVAVIASYGSGVAVISAALRCDPPIPHEVLFDEAFATLASRLGAFLLEPKVRAGRDQDLATTLDLLTDAYKAKGGKTALALAKKIAGYAAYARQGKPPSIKLVKAIGELLTGIEEEPFSGKPDRDWARMKRALRATSEQHLGEIAGALDYLVAFNRGQTIGANLSRLWLEHGAYVGARGALDSAFAQEQVLSGGDDWRGIHVMNMHRCKGKQFDGVVLFRAQHCSPFVWRDEAAPYPKSRKLLHVAIPRAKTHVLILDDAYSTCPIVDPFKL